MASYIKNCELVFKQYNLDVFNSEVDIRCHHSLPAIRVLSQEGYAVHTLLQEEAKRDFFGEDIDQFITTVKQFSNPSSLCMDYVDQANKLSGKVEKFNLFRV